MSTMHLRTMHLSTMHLSTRVHDTMSEATR